MANLFNIDSVIAKLLKFRCGRSTRKFPELTHAEIQSLASQSREIFLAQPMLLELQAPIKVCGDVHGQFTDLRCLFQRGGSLPTTQYLFLGDYVDRGQNSVETIALLFAYKIKYPNRIYLLRGNHESKDMNEIYGFYDECRIRYNVKLWKSIVDVFNCLPVAAIISDKIFCCHGGLSPALDTMDDIRRLERPIEVPDEGLLCDLLWADPDENTIEWDDNHERQISVTFGSRIVENFLTKHGFDLIIRAHEVVENGFKFFAGRKLVTIFSAPNYGGHGNYGAIMAIDEQLLCSFHKIE